MTSHEWQGPVPEWIANSKQPITLCDEQGVPLGCFVPTSYITESEREWVAQTFTDEVIDRARHDAQETGARITMKELRDQLKAS